MSWSNTAADSRPDGASFFFVQEYSLIYTVHKLSYFIQQDQKEKKKNKSNEALVKNVCSYIRKTLTDSNHTSNVNLSSEDVSLQRHLSFPGTCKPLSLGRSTAGVWCRCNYWGFFVCLSLQQRKMNERNKWLISDRIWKYRNWPVWLDGCFGPSKQTRHWRGTT